MEKDFIHKETCGICGGSSLTLVLDLGEMPLANAFLRKEDLDKPEEKFPLRVYFCGHCSSLQLLDIVNPDVLFKHYDYLTSASKPLVDHFVDMGKELAGKFVTSSGDLFLEIGGNDGVLLEGIKNVCRVVNVEPAENVADISREKGIETIVEFFTEDLAQKIVSQYGNAKVVVANNVMAHMRNLREMFAGVKKLIGEDGVFVFEVHWVGNLIGEGGFDQIYHEHVFYHSLTALKYLAESLGLQIFNIALVPIHGQSTRVFIAKSRAVDKSVAEFLKKERGMGLDKVATFQRFAERVKKNKEELKKLLIGLKTEGKKVAGYGAPAKGNTLLNYFKIGPDILDFLTDTTILKQGLYSPGMHVPVVSSKILDEVAVDYLLLLAWNYKDAILEREKRLRSRGVKFVIPVPRVAVV